MTQASFRTLIDRYALFAAVIVGAVGFRLFRHLTPLLPPMIFLMLFFTFCKVNPLDLRLHRWHFTALAVQLLLALGSWALLTWLGSVFPAMNNPVVAQSLMLCFLMPTATAAPIIAGKLGGSIQNLTTFTLLSNFATAVVVPLFFPLVNPVADMTFWTAALLIMRKVGPLLLGPFFAAWCLRLLYDFWPSNRARNRTFALSHAFAQFPFYIWVGTIVILMGDIVDTILTRPSGFWTLFWVTLGAVFSCLLQFRLGRMIGGRWPAGSHGIDYQDIVINPDTAPKTPAGISRVTAGQALGQKNTTLAIWMAQTYLLPLVSLGPAAYIIVQNFFNSAQLNRAARTRTQSTE